MEREPRHIYLDPLDAIWLTTAERIGFSVERSSEVYASTDGEGTMTIGTTETLDPDECHNAAWSVAFAADQFEHTQDQDDF